MLLYDPDVREDKKKWPGIAKMIAGIESRCQGFAAVWLPKGRDPGSLDRAFLPSTWRQKPRTKASRFRGNVADYNVRRVQHGHEGEVRVRVAGTGCYK